MDLEKSYPALFELLWYSQMPCFDVKGVTSNTRDEFGILKWCAWKGLRLSCSSIFSMFPTDRGMCCSFNMLKAEEMFRESKYRESVARFTKRDKDMSFQNSTVPEWFDPEPESGRLKGLSLMLDAHSDQVASSSIPDDFQGFTAVVDSRKQYPLTTRKSVMIRPGHSNVVSLGATKVTPNENIRSTDAKKRNCYFSDEKILKAHSKYSQVACTLECGLSHALDKLNGTDRCIPWYYPPVDPEVRVCDPFEARDFNKEIERMRADKCQDCLPDCDETHYTASVSASPFRKCDYKNMGLTALCNLGGSGDELGDVEPPMWGESVINQYRRAAGGNIPDYIDHTVHTNERHYIKGNKLDSAVFSASYDANEKYDAYQRDIALVTFYFETNTVFEFSREARLTLVGFISQVGGLLGLCLGFSLLSLIELIYWFTYRMGQNL